MSNIFMVGVDDSKINGLGHPSHIRRHTLPLNSEDLGRRGGMDILLETSCEAGVHITAAGGSA